MPSRRTFMLATAATLAAPYIVRNRARAATPIVRRDVMDMQPSDPFFSDYAKAVQQMHGLSGNDPRHWVNQAKIHADLCHHSELEFLHWHRPYIRFFEQICAKYSGNPDFALPYWNWSKNSGRLPAPFFDVPELNVEHWNDPGQYTGQAWGPIDTVGRRGLDKTHGLLDDPVRGGNFTLMRINAIKQLPDIDTFRPGLEGSPHNNGHVVTGATRSGKQGHMYSGLSPLDPIFWLHHCMVDRVWAEWQPGHVTPDPGSDYSGQFVDADGNPAQASSTLAMDIANLGYTYEILQAVPAAAVAAARVQPAPLQTIASATNAQASQVNVETAVEVAIPSLQNRATALRVQAAAGQPPSNNRILAKLSDITTPNTNDILVNVFVNCPYLSPDTPFSDPHYGGTFSFFSGPKMQGMPGMAGPTYVVDITTAVREAGFAPDKIKLQFMPVPAAAGGESSATFKVGKIEILGA